MSLFDDVRRLLEGGESDDESGRIEKPTEGVNYEREYAVALETARRLRSREGEVEVLAEGDDGELYSGSWGRGMFERAKQDGEQPVWLGYVEDQIGDAREVGIPFSNLQTHAGVFGTTGSGKTTALKNIMIQLAYGGHGFCYIDPKGEDVKKLLQILPEDRLDDIVWISPGADKERSVSFNLLEAPVPHDDPHFENAVTSMLDDLQSFIAGKHGGGARIEGVVDTIGRAMIESEKPYTLADMYFTLVDEDRRQAFAQEVDDDVVAEYAEKVANMPDDDLDALIRRLKKWVEGRVTREIVAMPESDLNFSEVIEEGKIVLVDNSAVDSDAIKQMVSTAVVRSIWATKKHRANMRPNEPRTPFFLIMDEFDDVVTSSSGETMQIGKILSKGRSFWLSLIMASQFPNQIPEEVRDELFGNTNTLLNLNVRHSKDASILAESLKEVNGQPITKADIIQLPNFKTWYQYALNGETKEPVVVNNFAPYPPVREKEAIDYLINRSLDRYGSDRLHVESLEDICLIDGTPSDEDEETPVELIHALDAIDIACLFEDADHASEETVRDVLDALDVDTGYVAFDQLIEQSGHFIDVQSGKPNRLGLTPEGKATLAEHQDTGAGGNAGSLKHRLLLQDTREELAQAGIAVFLPEQEGAMPDGLGYPFSLNDDSPLASLIDGHEMIHIEAETSTTTRPAKTLTNLVKAREKGVPCLFAVREKDGDLAYNAEKIERFISESPQCARETTPYGVWLYNYDGVFKRENHDGEMVYPIRPVDDDNGETRWYEADGRYVLLDSSDREHARFGNLDALLDWSPDDWPAHYTKQNGKVVVWHDGRPKRYSSITEMKEDDWAEIKTPFIPERDLPAGQLPTPDTFASLIIPSDDVDEDSHVHQHSQQTLLHDETIQTVPDEPSEPEPSQETTVEDEFRFGTDDEPDEEEIVIDLDDEPDEFDDEPVDEPEVSDDEQDEDEPDDEDDDEDDYSDTFLLR